MSNQLLWLYFFLIYLVLIHDILILQYSRDKRSIFGVGDISEVIPDEEADIAVLEEPEHLTWHHHGKRWKNKFRLVIGIIHTNYLEYVKRETNGMQALLLKYINKWLVGIYCHKVSHYNLYPFEIKILYIACFPQILVFTSTIDETNLSIRLNVQIGPICICQLSFGSSMFQKFYFDMQHVSNWSCHYNLSDFSVKC